MSISRELKTISASDINIYCDGCRKKIGDGGWASIIIGENFVKLLGGWEKDTTNNRMELLGPINALAVITQLSGKKILTTDSMYVVDGFNKWMHSWVRKHWRLKNGDPVKNLEHWKRLWDLKDNTKFKWVRGHSGHTENELCDSVANICCYNKLDINESFKNIDELSFYVSTFTPKT